MQFYIHPIKSPALKPWIQYLLFNTCKDKSCKATLSSFANTNYCLGIIKDKKLIQSGHQEFTVKDKAGINSYLTGIYLEPHNFLVNGELDEICIDFTPLGYYYFFRFPPKTLIHADILPEAFGNNALFFFEKVFACKDVSQRGELIEEFFLKNILPFNNIHLNHALSLIHKSKGCLSIKELSKSLACSEKYVYRTFVNQLDISPKDYIRVVRFRNSLESLYKNSNQTQSLQDLHFYDQSHFIKEMKYFTGITPKKIPQNIRNVQEAVFLRMDQ